MNNTYDKNWFYCFKNIQQEGIVLMVFAPIFEKLLPLAQKCVLNAATTSKSLCAKSVLYGGWLINSKKIPFIEPICEILHCHNEEWFTSSLRFSPFLWRFRRTKWSYTILNSLLIQRHCLHVNSNSADSLSSMCFLRE